jgi:transcriptional regulator with XRE-family HTH domain
MARNGTGGLDELSRTLRELRRPPGQPLRLTLGQAAEATGFSISKINRIEHGKTVPAPADVVALARAYGAGTTTRSHLRMLAETVKASSRRVVLSRANREEFQRRLREIERASAVIREFSPIIIPGLLQTAEYMWEIAFSGSGGDRERAAAFVAERLGRQAILDEPGRLITILTTEGALGWAAGPGPMMARQLDNIAVVTSKPAVRVGIIPFGTPAATFPVSNWILYDERAAVPGILRTQTILNPPDVDPYVEQFEQLAPLAVFDDEAREILTAVADRYRAMRPT